MTRPDLEPGYQVEKLREAAERLDCRRGIPAVSLHLPVAASWLDGLHGRTRRCELPDVLCAPIRLVLLAAAEQIERAGSTLGQPVNHALQLAGVLLSEDLGHNR